MQSIGTFSVMPNDRIKPAWALPWRGKVRESQHLNQDRMEPTTNKKEQILISITGLDRPGLTASVMEILAKYDTQILDIGQADIHSTLSLGILIRIEEHNSGQVMKELLFKATELSVNIGFQPVSDDKYEDWVSRQGKNRYILTMYLETSKQP